MNNSINNIEKKLIEYIEDNDINNAQILLNNFEFHYGFYVQILQSASRKGNFDIAKIILDNNLADPSTDNNIALVTACSYGFFKIVNLLLSDNRVNPEDNENTAIKLAYEYEHFDIVDLLWKYERVRKNLENDHKELYDELIKQDISNKIEGF